MLNWQQQLNGDPLPWLLDPANPSVRYWALRDILARPADDPDVQAARAAIAAQPLVQALFALQQPQGHWGEDATRPYTAQGAVGVLSLLHLLGVPPDERTAKGCDSFLTFSQHGSGGLSMTRTQRSGIFPCTTGEHLPLLVYFGFGDDQRVRAAFTFLIEDHLRADALDCARYQHRACLWGAIAALNGLAVLPPAMKSAQSVQVVEKLADALLDAPYDLPASTGVGSLLACRAAGICSARSRRWPRTAMPATGALRRCWRCCYGSRTRRGAGCAAPPRARGRWSSATSRASG